MTSEPAARVPEAGLAATDWAQVQGLELQARLIVEGYLSGLHKSPYRGFSVEFAEHREYVPGDDLRYVDWKVFGKTDRYFLKQYEEETNFACTLLVDTSESMTYRSTGAAVSKLDYARALAAALAYLVIQQRDAVGLATFDKAVRQFVRPQGTTTQFREICRLLEETPGTGESGIGPILQELAERILRRGILVLITDAFDEFAGLERGLRHLQYRRHDLIVLQVIDPAEAEFPFQEPTLFRGLEGWADQPTDPRALRQAYLTEFQQHTGRLRGLCRELHLDYRLAQTDQPVGLLLGEVLNARRGRRGT